MFLGVVGLNFYLYGAIAKGFFPQQDTGRLIGFIQADQGISFQAMRGKLTNFIEIVREVPALAPYRDALAGRSMLCVRADVVPIECVIRGYITGSAWKEYQAHGTLAGEALAVGLRESDRLDPPIFSPATKAETGHDENITIASVIASVGAVPAFAAM